MDYEAYAKEFYGTSYHNAKNPTKLHDACKWLDKALKFKTQNKLNIKKNQNNLQHNSQNQNKNLHIIPQQTNILNLNKSINYSLLSL